MATIPEAREMGFTFPTGSDLISLGDDAIQTNALAAATGIKNATMPKGYPGPRDFDTLRKTAVYTFASPFPDDGSTNFPEGVESAAALLVLGTPSGSWCAQEVYQYGNNPRRWWRISRTTQTMGPWIEVGGSTGIGSAMASNAAHQTRFVSATGGVVDTGGKAAFALRLDHGWSTIKASLRSELLARGIVAGVATNSRKWGIDDNTGVTPAEVNGWVANGEFEILNHSATHNGGMDEAGLVDEIVNGRLELESQLPAAAPIWGFAPPGVTQGWDGFNGGNLAGWTSPSAQIILASHAYSLGYVGGARRVLDGTIRQGLSHITLDEYDMTLARAQVDAAITERRGIQVMLHPSRLDQPGKITTAQFLSFLDYVIAKRDAGQLVTLSPGELVRADATRPPVTVPDVTGLASRLAALEYDSGLRNITAGIVDTPTSGGLYIRRQGNVITYSVSEILYGSAASLVNLGSIPVGFRPSNRDVEFASSRRQAADTNVGIRVTAGGNLWAYRVEAGQAFRGSTTWVTTDPIPAPSALPGAPA